MELTRSVTFRAAFDRRHPDPSENYGVHGVEILFVVRGPRGATQFLLYTNWQLPDVTSEFLRKPNFPSSLLLPMPADLGYHAYEPRYEGQTRMGECDVLPDAEGGCYYDGSSLNAKPVFERLLREGDAGVWDALESYYHECFAEVEIGQVN